MQNSERWWAVPVLLLFGCGSGAVVSLQSVERSEPSAASAGVTASDYVSKLDLLAVGYRDGAFELRSPAPDHVLSRGKHPSSIVNLALSPDGARLATIDATGTLAVSDVQSGELHEIDGDSFVPIAPASLLGLAWDPAGERLAIAAGLRVRVLDLAQGTRREVMLAEQVAAVAYAHDGKQLVVVGQRLHLLDAERLSQQRELTLPPRPANGRAFTVTDARFSPDDSRLAVLLLGGLALVDVTSGEVQLAELRELDPVGVRFAADGKIAVFGRHGLYVGEADAQRMPTAAHEVKGELADVEFRKDGSLLFLGAVEDTEQALLEWHL
jgi:WD40 repeat protein